MVYVMATTHPPVPEDGPLFELDDVPPADDQDAVAAEIRALMGRHRVSQSRLASAMGMSPAGMSERLNGKTNFTIREIGRIARFFGKSLGGLVARAERSEDGFLNVTKIEYPLGYAPPVAVQLALFGGTEISQPDITSIPATTALSTPGTRVTSRKAA